ncbi:hypothetical protein RIF29_17188 [Crotalaria pallida]|uniref:Uncharacterized protein n=1 Tax=Crotalaria pallida TaxID=3830 RepID=A0AAN9FGN8_CROPI
MLLSLLLRCRTMVIISPSTKLSSYRQKSILDEKENTSNPNPSHVYLVDSVSSSAVSNQFPDNITVSVAGGFIFHSAED